MQKSNNYQTLSRNFIIMSVSLPNKPTRTSTSRLYGIIAGLAGFFIVAFFFDLDPKHPEITCALAVTIIMAIWWISEAVPIAITSLLPVALFPVCGVADGQVVSSAYFNHVIFLFMGGFLMALAMEKWNLHKRIALKILLMVGLSPASILFGFMFATAFLSMWISNTATAMMMVPIVISVTGEMERKLSPGEARKYGIGLLLGVAYSASVGGMATLVGTPPNLAFSRIFTIMFPEAPEISFSEWMSLGLPIAVVMFFVVYFYLSFLFLPKKNSKGTGKQQIKEAYQELGPVKKEEKIVLAAFIILAFLWIFRKDLDLGFVLIPGWARLFPYPEYLNDGTSAMIIGINLFLIPSTQKNDMIMDWTTARRLPWRIILLFGGGFALAEGLASSGFSAWFGDQLSFLSGVHPLLMIFIIALMLSFLTEITSNTATTQIILPILASMAVSMKVHPLLFMLPATLAASMAFMLPVATPPNAIVFGTNRLTIKTMAKNGFLLNLIGVILVSLMVYYLGGMLSDVPLSELPVWAIKSR